MKKQLQTILVIFIAFSLQLQAQPELAPCGTDDNFSPWLRAYLNSGSPSSRTDEILYVPIQIHVVGTDEGSGYMSKETVLESFCTLNNSFADSDIQFFLADEFNYIDNTAYYDYEDYDVGDDMMYGNNVSNAINCYIVENAAGACGYYTYGADAIGLSKNCTKPSDQTWAHEVGHFLSLPHTFWGWEWADDDELTFNGPAPDQISGGVNVEKVDGSNCADSADRFCDTPTDYLNYRWTCNSEGFSNRTQIDPDGVEFNSDGSFFMSYSNASCKNRFSEEQMDAMRANIELERPELLAIISPNNEDITIPESATLIQVSPEEGAVVVGDSVLLEWEPIPNATHYIVQINPFSFFSIIFNEFLVEGNSMIFTNLIPDETFFWRVLPYNSYHTCAGFTSKESFNTGAIVGVNELSEGESLRLFPNPAKDGFIWMEIKSLSSSTAQWELADISGRVIQKGEERITNGMQKISINTSGLAGGMYIANLQLGDKKVFRKFIVQ